MDSVDLNSSARRGNAQNTAAKPTPRLGLLATDDLSALAWVHGELRRSLEAANKSLRRYLREVDTARLSDLDAVEPAVLRTARTQLHQGVGALELVDLPAAAQVLRAAENLVSRMISKPSAGTSAAVDAVERVSFALLDFVGRYLAGKPVSAVAMFPQYEAAMVLAGAERVHPADLWHAGVSAMTWADGLGAGPGPAPGAADLPRRADDTSRSEMESLVLGLMREPGRNTCLRMSQLCADLAAGTRQQPGEQPLTGLWQAAAAVYEALANGLLANDVHTKRVASRLLAQLRASARGQVGPSERLAQDLVFFCAHASQPAVDRPSPRLAAARKAWKLDGLAIGDYSRPRLGLHDPSQLASAKRRVATAKDTWAAVAGDEYHRLSSLMEQFALVGDSLQRLFPAGDSLAHALSLAAAQTAASLAAPPAPLAMEVATAFLYVDAVLDGGELDQPDLAERVQQLAQRVEQVRAGAAQKPLEAWMEELYRRVSDRQTMGSVVQELRASLSEVEKQIDQFFRQPADRAPIVAVPGQLSSMRGVLSVLGMDHASQAVLHMRDDVEALLQTEVHPQQAIRSGTFNRLADNLGALSFLIDMLSVQPQLAKALFTFDADTGSLSATMGLGERVSAFGELGGVVSTAPTPAPVPSPGVAMPRAAPAPTVMAPVVVTSAGRAKPAGDSKLQVRMQALAAEAAQPNLGDNELMASLDVVTQQALAADRSDLARMLAVAQRGLRDSIDPTSSRAIRAELVRALAEATTPVPMPMPEERPVPAPRPTPAGGTGLEDDAEMRAIFIEEARDVTDQALQALQLGQAGAVGGPTVDMTTIRRSFHTLKGSARMVGLRDFGEAAWACEQLYNVRLAQSPVPDEPLVKLTSEALAYLRSWTDAIDAGVPGGHSAQGVVGAAEALRLRGIRLPIAPAAARTPTVSAATAVATAPARPVSVPSMLPSMVPPVVPPIAPPPAFLPAEASLASRVSNLPSAADLDLVPLQPVRVPEGLESEVDLELALDGDLPAESTAPAPAAIPVFAVGNASGTVDADRPAAFVDFTFDLEGAESAPASAPEAEPVPVPVPAAPVLPAVEALELELEDYAEFMASDGAVPVAAAEAEVEPAQIAAAEAVLAAAAAAAVPQAWAPPVSVASGEEEENFKRIGPLRISIPLFNIFLNEADELSRRLVNELAEWALESQQRAVPETCVALAHGLAGSAGTVGCADLSGLARALENALMRSHAAGPGRPGESGLFSETAEEIRRLLHQFAAGFLRDVPAALRQRLVEHERLPASVHITEAGYMDAGGEPDSLGHSGRAAPPSALSPATLAVVPQTTPAPQRALEAMPTAVPLPVVSAKAAMAALPLVPTGAGKDAFDDDQDIDVEDSVDAELFPIFDEEAEELLPQLQARLREWMHQPGEEGPPAACMRTLHTFKGGARLAGAMRLGEMAHRLETAIEHLAAREGILAADVLPLLARADGMVSGLEQLRRQAHAAESKAQPASTPLTAATATPTAEQPVAPQGETQAGSLPALALTQPSPPPAVATPTFGGAGVGDGVAEIDKPAGAAPLVDWRRFERGSAALASSEERASSGPAGVRVRAALLDRLLNQAGEVTITRSRIDADVKQLQSGLGELAGSLDRMRHQLRDIEVQAESQISSRLEAAKAAAQAFDPLEMDRFTRLQELTRFMAESVNDVATLHRGLQRTLQSAEDQLAAQSRLTRDLQDDLLRTRMVEFESAADRLYRTLRQAAKEAGKQVRLDIVGGAIELDRGVLERMIGPFEHLVRNCVAHGVEPEAERLAAGKSAVGQVTISVAQSGNEVAVDIADDGAGLDLQRIRLRAIERRLLPDGSAPSEAELSQLIFKPGFSTADAVTELAGRGVGLDVVRAEVTAMGGRIETQTMTGKGTRFKLLLPLTTAVTQVVMLRCDTMVVAVPSTLIEGIRRVPGAEVEAAYGSGLLNVDGEALPFYWLAALLQASTRGGTAEGRTQAVAVVRSAAQRVAVHIDEVMGNQEVVVKNVGPQLARVPGLTGVTLLPSGAVSLIYNPVALSAVYGEQLRAARAAGSMAALGGAAAGAAAAPQKQPLVMVVDDSLTVRRATERLLVREGYRVVTAKDGMEALELLAGERPVALLSDIEMPRMDGFDLLRNVRADVRLHDLPVVMITSRIAHKHREHASELGADHYLGKPYGEDELLRLVARYAAGHARAGTAA